MLFFCFDCQGFFVRSNRYVYTKRVRNLWNIFLSMSSQLNVIGKTHRLWRQTFVWVCVLVFWFSHLSASIVASEDIVEPTTPVEVTSLDSPAESVQVPVEAPVENEQHETELPQEEIIDELVVNSGGNLPFTGGGETFSVEVTTGGTTGDIISTHTGTDTIGNGNMAPLPEEQETGNIALPRIIWIQEGKIAIDGNKASAVLIKDEKLQIREIQIQETAMITGSIGVTIIIPEDTKIFSPGDTSKEDAIQPLLDEEVNSGDTSEEPIFSGMNSEIIESSFEGEMEMASEEVVSLVEETPSVVEDEQPNTEQQEQVIEEQDQIEIPVEESTGSGNAEETSEEEKELPMKKSDTNANPVAGQLPLQGDGLLIEEYDQVMPVISQTWVTAKAFTFGLEEQHLVFTKPVEIRVNMSSYQDGQSVMIRVKHVWDPSFGTRWLSNDPTATCDDKGNISRESDNALVVDGEVVFYTCGASAFTISVGDGTFNLAPNGTVSWVLQLSNGNILVAGVFRTIGGITRTGIALIDAAGSVVPAFNAQLNGTGNVFAMVEQPDGKIVIGWTFLSVSGDANYAAMARITNTWMLDTSFNVAFYDTGLWVQKHVANIVLRENGKFFVGGWFSWVNGEVWAMYNRLFVPLTSTGMVDPDFRGRITNGFTWAPALADDGSGWLYIGGNFTLVSGSNIWFNVFRNGLAHFFSDGTLDTAFGTILTGTTNYHIERIHVQPDRNIIVVWPNVANTITLWTRYKILRFTTTGMWDSGYNGSIPVWGAVYGTLMQPDGRLIVWWNFNTWYGLQRYGLVRLDKDGNADPTFEINVNSVWSPKTLGIDANGYFYTYGINTLMAMSVNIFARVGILPSECGGMEGCSTWLKATDGVTAGSTWLVQYWANMSSYDMLSGSQATVSARPKYVTWAMNFNPVIRFSSGNFMLFASKFLFRADNSHFAVIRTTSNRGVVMTVSSGMLLNPQVSGTCDRTLSLSGWYAWSTLGVENIQTNTLVNDNNPQLISRRYGTWLWNEHALWLGGSWSSNVKGNVWTGGWAATWAAATPTLSVSSNMIIGNAGTNCIVNGQFSGDIAEILMFNRRLSDTETQTVNSYLALKYGITIDQTTPTDYIFSGWTTAWSASSADIYKNNIAGVGRNDTSSLNQIKSQTANSATGIIVEYVWAGSITNNRTLVWGDNLWPATTWYNTGEVPGWFLRVGRSWKFQERNGDLGTIRVYLVTGSYEALVTWSMYMFVSTGAIWLTGDATSKYTGFYVWSATDGAWNFTGDIGDNALVTFGYLTNDQAPTWLSLTTWLIADGASTGTLIGLFSTTDPDVGDTFSYTMDSTCSGTLDNAKFTVSSTGALLLATPISYSSQTWASICVRTTDRLGLSYTWLFNLIVVPPVVWIDAPTSLSFSSRNRALATGTISQTFNTSTGQGFYVTDYAGSDVGYSSTLQMSGVGLINGNGDVIPAGNLSLINKPAIFTYSGDVNGNVMPGSTIGGPFPLNTPQTLIWRDNGANFSKKWIYGVYLPLALTVPGTQMDGVYTGTLVFTLIMN